MMTCGPRPPCLALLACLFLAGCGGGGSTEEGGGEAAGSEGGQPAAEAEASAEAVSGGEESALDPNLQSLVYLLESENPEGRIRALLRIGKLGEEAHPILAQVLARKDDEDADVRSTLVGTLVAIEGGRALEHLGELLHDSSNLVRGEVIQKLAALKGPGVTDLLLEAMKDEEARVRAAAIHALGVRGDASEVVISRIEDALDDYEGTVIRQAVESLGELLATGSVSRIARCLLDRDDGVRQIACRSLERLGTANGDAVYGLIGCMDDDSLGVREAAFRALVAITGSEETFGYDPAEVDDETREAALQRWRDFWEARSKEGK